MAEETLKSEVIQENPFPSTEHGTVEVTNPSGGTSQTNLKPDETAVRNFPTQTIANSVIADSLNTQERRILSEYTFGEFGAIKIGKYVDGVSGEVNISPNGISAKNKDNETTVTIDGTTGDATFKGTIAANSFIAGRVDIGTSGNVYIDGTNGRIIISDGTNDRIILGFGSGLF